MKKYYVLLLLAAISLPVNNLMRGTVMPAIKTILPADIDGASLPDNSDALAQILGHNLWDKRRGQILEHGPAADKAGATKGVATATDRNWQLKAVKMPDIAVVKTAKGIEHYAPRQTLPSGEVLHEILIDGIVLEKNSEKHNVYLFGKKPKPHH